MNTNYKLFLRAALFALSAGFFIACDKEDDKDMMAPAEAQLMVADQTISQNTIKVEMTDLPADGWIVIHRSMSSGGPVVPGIISEPVKVMKGESFDVPVAILATEPLMDGEKLWVMLHTETGTIGQYEFDGANGFDPPFTDNDGDIVMKSITITTPSISVMNQPVNNNSIVIAEVNAAADGWLVVHNDDGNGGIVLPGIIGKTRVQKGINTNVVVMLDPMNTYVPGQKLFPMLHLDNGIIGQYEFDGASAFDGPEVFSNDPFPGNVIFTSFDVQ